ncbi:helix-turn-helix domain-containing protein [Streptomyces rimosus]|uniref:helix-turn-helix domain-containing protein n=1 Tax=Streptomyces rimosus TaxID=1927 RepID=UPI003787E9A9
MVPVELPDHVWEYAAVRQALRSRDVGAVFRHVQQYGGAGQARIAMAVGMTQARVNEIINGRREVVRLDVFERVADGLSLPDDARHLLGLAAGRERRVGGPAFGLASFPEVVRVYQTQAAAAQDIREQARTASEWDVLAVRGLGLIGLKDSMLRPCLPGRRRRHPAYGFFCWTPRPPHWHGGRPKSVSRPSRWPVGCDSPGTPPCSCLLSIPGGKGTSPRHTR